MMPLGVDPPEVVLFDRDGTLVVDVPYNGDPERVRPVPGAAEALARLREAGVPTTVSRRAGMIHRFLFFPGLVGAADAALDEACAWLRGAFADRP